MQQLWFICTIKEIYLGTVVVELPTWQKQLMASDYNLIDFSDASSENNKEQQQYPNPVVSSAESEAMPSSSVTPISNTVNETIDKNVVSSSVSTSSTVTTRPPNKSNKSLFEITRVESNHGDSVGGEDSEMDDSVSSSTSILEMISKSEKEETSSVIDSTAQKTTTELVTTTSSTQTQINNVSVSDSSMTFSHTNQPQSTISQVTLQQQSITTVTSTTSATQTSAEPQSRFRIVKIAKPKPYERGTWLVNDFNDSQKQSETENAPSSPAVKRNRNPMSESGGVTSPTEPVKTKSSEFLAQNLPNAQSRGSSYNTSGDRRSSVESTAVSESGSGTPIVTPMVEALEMALDQIQSIRDSMLVSVSDEVKKMKETLEKTQLENTRLKDENESLKIKLSAAEDRIAALEKG